MCGRVLQLLLAALFVFIVATVAAFVYLPWWQAFLASGLTFLLLIAGGKVLISSAIANLGEFAKEMLNIKGKVLHGATIQVHKVEPIEPPAEAFQQLPEEFDDDEERQEYEQQQERLRSANWYRIETTIFPSPDAQGPMTHWDIDDLRLVPSTAKPPSFDMNEDDDESDEDFELYDMQIIVNGQSHTPDDSKFLGPQRLRFVVGVPGSVSELTFRYYFEQFGLIRLPSKMLPGRG